MTSDSFFNKALQTLQKGLEQVTDNLTESVSDAANENVAKVCKDVAEGSKNVIENIKDKVILNIPIKILGQSHSHSRSNSSSSGDNERFSQPPPTHSQQPHQSQQSSQQPQQPQQIPTINTSNMHHPNSNGFSSSFPSRSPIPEFSNFPSSAFGNDRDDWMNFPNFPNFPSNFSRDAGSNFPNFPNFGRDGGLSPNPQTPMQNLRRSPTPTRTASPTATLRRNSNQGPNMNANQQYQQQAPTHAATSSAANSRPSSRMSKEREPKTNEVPERPAVIPLPYEKTRSSQEKDVKRNSKDREVLEDNIAKITIGKDNREAPSAEEVDGDPAPLTPSGVSKKGKKLQRKQSVADFNAKTIVTLDKIEIQVEQLRKKAAELEMEKDQILRSLGEISVHNCMLKLAECDREEIEAITERLNKRTETVQVAVETPRNEEQKKALEEATKMMDGVNDMMQTNIEKAKVCLQTYLNACSSEETTGATCQNFLKVIIQCAADDQKRIKRRLANLMSQIENAEKATADLIDEESE